MARQLDFYFFIGSTYTYLSVMRIESEASSVDINVRWRPFFLRTILLEQNYSPFVGKPAKLRYMWRDLERRAGHHRVEFNGIPPYPVDPDGLANRIAWLASLEGWCPQFTKAVYRDWFLEHRVPGEPDGTRQLLARLGHDADATIERANSGQNRATLDEVTSAAAAMGIFGSPTFAVGPEIFWGDDRLEDAVEWPCRADPG